MIFCQIVFCNEDYNFRIWMTEIKSCEPPTNLQFFGQMNISKCWPLQKNLVLTENKAKFPPIVSQWKGMFTDWCIVVVAKKQSTHSSPKVARSPWTTNFILKVRKYLPTHLAVPASQADNSSDFINCWSCVENNSHVLSHLFSIELKQRSSLVFSRNQMFNI